MREPIEQRRRHFRISEDRAPFAEGQVGGDDQRDALVELADQMEQERPPVRREGQVTEFIEYDGILVKQAVGEMSGATRALFGIELIHQINHAVEACPLTLKDGVPSQGGRQMRLAGSGSANENDIAGGGEIVSGIQLPEPRFVHCGFFEVEAVDVPRDGEAREAQLVFVGAGLAVRHFSLQQLRQPGRRGEFLLAQGRQALLQRARHPAQAQGFQLFGQLLGLHDFPQDDDGWGQQ